MISGLMVVWPLWVRRLSCVGVRLLSYAFSKSWTQMVVRWAQKILVFKVLRVASKIKLLLRALLWLPLILPQVVVASKVPPPNYHQDLDDKLPQREVVIPLSLQRRVEGLLQEYLDRLLLNYATGNLDDVNSAIEVKEIDIDENTDSFVDESVMEKVLHKRSLRMRNTQRA
ncbi:hypothetical protein VNO80_26691 [Phaseolus coccineus]|uniref:Uncharacterized protein n=1 Tax=Phaseolus coccineus TaxID=3886 RepID=A0AAN9QGY6_PHACN